MKYLIISCLLIVSLKISAQDCTANISSTETRNLERGNERLSIGHPAS